MTVVEQRMKYVLTVVGHVCLGSGPTESRFVGDAKHIANRVILPRRRYTLPDFNKNWRGRLMQMVVDHLHKAEIESSAGLSPLGA